MTETSDRPNRFPWPPVIYPLAFAASVLLAWLAPLPFIPSPLADILFALGFLVVAGGLALYIGALLELRRAGTTKAPHEPVSHLVTGGPFRISRNPIYLGATMVMFGIGLIFGIWWLFLGGLAAALLTTKLAIEGEERHLQTRFGKRYRDYAKTVRRWF